MIKAIHQSMLNMAFRCGESFRRRYIENEIIPPGIAAGRGTGLHYANKVNLRQKIQTGLDLPISDIKDAARDGYVKAFEGGVYIPKDQLPEKEKLLNEGLDDSIRCAEVYLEKVAPEIKPKAVEEPFTIEVGLALPLSGTIDIEQEAKVDDLKTSSKKWAEGQIQKELQPIMYSFAHEKMTGIRPLFKYHILIARRGKYGPTSAGYDSQEITCTDRHYSALIANLNVFIEMLQKGVFTPANPTSWWCGSADWCGYFPTCPYMGNGKQLKWI